MNRNSHIRRWHVIVYSKVAVLLLGGNYEEHGDPPASTGGGVRVQSEVAVLLLVGHVRVHVRLVPAGVVCLYSSDFRCGRKIG